MTFASRDLLQLDFKKPEVLLDIQNILRHNSCDTATIHHIYNLSCFAQRIDVLEFLDNNFKIDHSYKDNNFIRWAANAGKGQTISYLLQFEDTDFSASDNEAIINLYFGNKFLYFKFYLNEKVQVKSYLLGQFIHKKEIIEKLKKTKPYLFI